MKDGRIVNGRRLNEDTFTVQLIDDKERLRSIESGPPQLRGRDEVDDAVVQRQTDER